MSNKLLQIAMANSKGELHKYKRNKYELTLCFVKKVGDNDYYGFLFVWEGRDDVEYKGYLNLANNEIGFWFVNEYELI